MELVFEFLFDLIIEGGMELSKSKKVPLPIWIILGVILVAFFVGVIGLIGFVGVMMFPDNVPAGIFFLAISAMLAILLVRRGITTFRRRRF